MQGVLSENKLTAVTLILILCSGHHFVHAVTTNKCAYVADMKLVNPATNATIGDLPDELYLDDYVKTAKFNIRVDVDDWSCANSIRSVLIRYSSTSEPAFSVCESILPYSVFGDYSSNGGRKYKGHPFQDFDATVVIKAIPYFRSDCTGVRGQIKRQFLQIYSSFEDTPSPTFQPTLPPQENTACRPTDGCVAPDEATTISLPGYASLEFEAGMFQDDSYVIIDTSPSSETNSIFTAPATAIFRPGPSRLSYDVIVTVDHKPLLADIPVTMDVPRSFLLNVPSGQHIAPFALMDINEGTSGLFNLIDGSIYDPVARKIRFILPGSAFTFDDGAYQAIISLASTPGYGTSAGRRRLAPFSGLCQGPSLSCPVQGNCTVISAFEYQRIYPSSEHPVVHLGTDYKTTTTTAVLAPASGAVESVGRFPLRFGNTIVLRHPDGSATLYGFLSSIIVTQGQNVLVGQTIGYGGAMSIHFALAPNGALYNVEGYVNPDACVGPTARRGSITIENDGTAADDQFTITLNGFTLGTTTVGGNLSVNNLIPGLYPLSLKVARSAHDSVGTWRIKLSDGLKFRDGTSEKSGSGDVGEIFTFRVVVPEDAGVKDSFTSDFWTQALIDCNADPVCAWGQKDGGAGASRIDASRNNGLVTSALSLSFCASSTTYGIPVAIIKALASRGSNMGADFPISACRSGYTGKDGGTCNGYGILQLDKRYISLQGTNDPRSQVHISQAVGIFARYLFNIADDHPDWAPKYLLKAAVVAYYKSEQTVIDSLANMDRVTENGDFASDVMTQALWFHLNSDKC